MKTLVIQRGHVPRTTGYTGTAGEQEVVTAIAAGITSVVWHLLKTLNGK